MISKVDLNDGAKRACPLTVFEANLVIIYNNITFKMTVNKSKFWS